MLTAAVPSLSDDDPVDVGETAAEGTGSDGSRSDHAHELPIGDTLEWNNSDELQVNDERVTDLLTEYIQYHTSITFADSTERSCAGQQYGTSGFEKQILKIRARFGRDEPHYYRATVARVTSSTDGTIAVVYGRSVIGQEIQGGGIHTLRFDPPVELPAQAENIVILVCRTNAMGTGGSTTERVDLIRGTEENTSPSQSYDDASLDFDFQRSVWYTESYPEVGDDRHSHDDDLILGNIEIRYTESIHHSARLNQDIPEISASAADPTGGNAGDFHLEHDSSDVVQSLWRRGGTDWSEYTVPAGGGSLSDTAPVSVSIAANSAGTATDGSRRDHRHTIAQASTTALGVSRYATNAQAIAATSTSRAMTPANVDHVLESYRFATLAYDDTVAYAVGEAVRSGADDANKVYVASRAIAAGGGAPSQQDRSDWWTVGQSGSYLGTLDSTLSYEIQAGDSYIVSDRVYLATAAAAAQTGIDLSTGTGVIQLSVSSAEFDLWEDVDTGVTAPHSSDRLVIGAAEVTGNPNRFMLVGHLVPNWQDEGTGVVDYPRHIDCVGDGIDCEVDGVGLTVTVPGGGGETFTGVSPGSRIQPTWISPRPTSTHFRTRL